jgi:hypothetical protein
MLIGGGRAMVRWVWDEGVERDGLRDLDARGRVSTK